MKQTPHVPFEHSEEVLLHQLSTHLQQAEALNKPATHPAAATLQCLIEHLKEEKQYGLWQVCPKCEGEGKVSNFTPSTFVPLVSRTCPLCKGEGKLLRPEIKPG